MEKSDINQKNVVTEDDMKKYFASYSSNYDNFDQNFFSKEKNNNGSKFTAKKIYKGYIDDPRNTDNAW